MKTFGERWASCTVRPLLPRQRQRPQRLSASIEFCHLGAIANQGTQERP